MHKMCQPENDINEIEDVDEGELKKLIEEDLSLCFK